MNGHEYDINFVNDVDVALGPTRVMRLAFNVLHDGVGKQSDRG